MTIVSILQPILRQSFAVQHLFSLSNSFGMRRRDGRADKFTMTLAAGIELQQKAKPLEETNKRLSATISCNDEAQRWSCNNELQQ